MTGAVIETTMCAPPELVIRALMESSNILVADWVEDVAAEMFGEVQGADARAYRMADDAAWSESLRV